MPYQITEDRRAEYRRTSQAARLAKQRALRGEGPPPIHEINQPRLDIEALMPVREALGMRALFSEGERKRCLGVREALGLPDIGVDGIAPTLRSGFTGPRFSTSILNSKASVATWARLGIWPNGIARDRERARLFVPKNGHFRLSVQDCALLQGFPASWRFSGAVYQVLGQIGNAVVPPVAYRIAESVASALRVIGWFPNGSLQA